MDQETMDFFEKLIDFWRYFTAMLRGVPATKEQESEHRILVSALRGKSPVVFSVSHLNSTGYNLVVSDPDVPEECEWLRQEGPVASQVNVGTIRHRGVIRHCWRGGEGFNLVFTHADRLAEMLTADGIDDKRLWRGWAKATRHSDEKVSFRIGDDQAWIPKGIVRIDAFGRFMRIAFTGAINLPNTQPFKLYIDGKEQDGLYVVYSYNYNVGHGTPGHVVLHKVDD